MKSLIVSLGATALLTFVPTLFATQADDTTITINGQTPGVTPFISQVSLTASDTSTIKSIQFAIASKPGSVVRPLTGTYSSSYLLSRGDLQPGTGQIFLPVYGLYSGFSNSVTLTYFFNDSSSKTDNLTIATASFSHPCHLDSPTVLQARTKDKNLSYDYMLVKGSCSSGDPAIVDTDGALRWVSPSGFSIIPSAFFDNAIYQADGSSLYRVDLDGTITFLHDYSDIGATDLHHNVDPGKFGLIIDIDRSDLTESVNAEVDAAGNVLKDSHGNNRVWNLAQIISAAMTAGGDNPNDFVAPAPNDWFHNNAVAYNRADDSILISSRENFIICLDYDTKAIKWILGDPTKKWHQFPSLAKFALTVPSGVPPIGQHAISITFDQGLLLFDNGFASNFQSPIGASRNFASPRKYQLNLQAKSATEVFNFEMGQSILSPICGSVYEDAPLNYVVDYAFVGGFQAMTNFAQLLGLNAAGKKIFYYQYPTGPCTTAYNTTPIHLEDSKFPAVAKKALNLSTRGSVGAGEDALIGGFIVTGSAAKSVVVRALGPSLGSVGVTGALADPVITLFDHTGTVIAKNDDWEDGANAAKIMSDGLAPSDPKEAAIPATLAPGAYTVSVTAKDSKPGVGLVEVYDLSPLATSQLGNISTRGNVGTSADVLISGFIVGDVDKSTVVVRALGPSLAAKGVNNPLSDPQLTVFDSNGSPLATNDNWQNGPTAADIQQNKLAPTNDAESAMILHLPAGAYTAIETGVGGGTGVGLIEVYNLN